MKKTTKKRMSKAPPAKTTKKNPIKSRNARMRQALETAKKARKGK